MNDQAITAAGFMFLTTGTWYKGLFYTYRVYLLTRETFKKDEQN